MISTKAELIGALRKYRSRLKDLGVEKLGLFGSFVRGSQSPESDVDLLVWFREGGKSFDNFMNLAFLLEDLLGHRVELVTAESLSPHIGPHILSEVEYVPLFDRVPAAHPG